jgi:hypothetical protein
MTFTEMYLVVKAGAHKSVNSSKKPWLVSPQAWIRTHYFCVLLHDAVSSWPTQRRGMIMY